MKICAQKAPNGALAEIRTPSDIEGVQEAIVAGGKQGFLSYCYWFYKSFNIKLKHR